MKKIILICLLLAGCNETQILTTTKYMVVHPAEAMYYCPVLKSFPDWNKLTDAQVAKTVLKL